jgi:hypothetical protein
MSFVFTQLMGHKPSLETICQASVSRKRVHRHGKQRTRLKGWHGRLVEVFTHWRKTIEICDVSHWRAYTAWLVKRKTVLLNWKEERQRMNIEAVHRYRGERRHIPLRISAARIKLAQLAMFSLIFGRRPVPISGGPSTYHVHASPQSFQANSGILPSIRHDHFHPRGHAVA